MNYSLSPAVQWHHPCWAGVVAVELLIQASAPRPAEQAQIWERKHGMY